MTNTLVQDRLGSVNNALSVAFGLTESNPQEIVSAISDIKTRDGLLYAVSANNYSDPDPEFSTVRLDHLLDAQQRLYHAVEAVLPLVPSKNCVYSFLSALSLMMDSAFHSLENAQKVNEILQDTEVPPTEIDNKFGSLGMLVLKGFNRGVPPRELCEIFRQSIAANPFGVVLAD